MRCGAYHELGHQRRQCITDKISCSLETRGRGLWELGEAARAAKLRATWGCLQNISCIEYISSFSNYCSQGIARWKAYGAKKREGYLKSWHQGEIETKARRNPCNSSETWHWLWLQQTGNTDESRKCSRKCKWMCSSLFSGPQICSGWKAGFPSNNLDPSITSNIHPQCQDLSVSHQANARAMREMASNTNRSFLLPLFGGGGVGVSLIPRIVFIVNCSRKFSEEKWRCAEFVVSLLSSGNRSGLLV